MTSQGSVSQVASSKQIREALGAVDESVITGLQQMGATGEEVGEAAAWLSSDDYLHRKLKHAAHGRVAQVIDFLEDCMEPPARE